MKRLCLQVLLMLLLLPEPRNGDTAKLKCHFLKDHSTPGLLIEVLDHVFVSMFLLETVKTL